MLPLGFLLLVAVSSTFAQTQPYCKLTSPDTEGPYWMNGAPVKNTTVCDSMTMSNTLVISGRVTDASCNEGMPSMLDVWQADERGMYSDGKFNYNCRSRIYTDPQGYYRYTTIFPARYKQDNGYRPAHIHYKVEPGREGFGTFITQMYFKDDVYLGTKDSCRGFCNSGDPTRQTEPKLAADGRTYETTFNIVLPKLWRKT